MTKLKRAPELKTTVLPDGYIAVFSGPSQNAYTIPPSGALAWEFFDGQNSTADVVKLVATELGVPESSELREQIEGLANELLKNGFLEPCSN